MIQASTTTIWTTRLTWVPTPRSTSIRTIDPGPGAFGLPADTDFYRVEALVSGTLDFQVVFEQINSVGARPGLPGNGDLNINVFDSDGQAIAGFTTSDDNDDNERVRIPAVQGEIYFFQVVGDGDAINAYDVTAINLAAGGSVRSGIGRQPDRRNDQSARKAATTATPADRSSITSPTITTPTIDLPIG